MGRAADLIETLSDVQFPIPILAAPDAVSTFCQCGCHKAESKCRTKNQNTNMRVSIAEREILSGEKKHIFLTGEKQVGKSTILNRVLEELCCYTGRLSDAASFIGGRRKGNYLHGLTGIAPYENDSPISIRVGEQKSVPLTETFETLGVKDTGRGFEVRYLDARR